MCELLVHIFRFRIIFESVGMRLICCRGGCLVSAARSQGQTHRFHVTRNFCKYQSFAAVVFVPRHGGDKPGVGTRLAPRCVWCVRARRTSHDRVLYCPASPLPADSKLARWGGKLVHWGDTCTALRFVQCRWPRLQQTAFAHRVVAHAVRHYEDAERRWAAARYLL